MDSFRFSVMQNCSCSVKFSGKPTNSCLWFKGPGEISGQDGVRVINTSRVMNEEEATPGQEFVGMVCTENITNSPRILQLHLNLHEGWLILLLEYKR